MMLGHSPQVGHGWEFAVALENFGVFMSGSSLRRRYRVKTNIIAWNFYYIFHAHIKNVGEFLSKNFD